MEWFQDTQTGSTLLGLQEGKLHQDGPLQGAGQRGPLRLYTPPVLTTGVLMAGRLGSLQAESRAQDKPACGPQSTQLGVSQEGPDQACELRSLCP